MKASNRTLAIRRVTPTRDVDGRWTKERVARPPFHLNYNKPARFANSVSQFFPLLHHSITVSDVI